MVLAMTSVIVDYKFKNVFLTFYILQAPLPPNCLSLWAWVCQNALINALKN